ncbi:MAG: dihydrodipicolinate synthase family protein [Ignavibacteriales bacterium]|nr:dihydrodipicolinate synthase family protein [Ignavibacteriales bacterium]
MKKLHGVIPPIATPFINQELAVDKLKENIQKLLQTDLAGILVLGSNGESVMLNEKEKLQVVEAAREVVPANKILLVGAGNDSTKETISFINKISKMGIEYALVITPSFYKSSMTSEVFYKHYSEVAEHSKAKVLMYNVPANTGVNISSETVAKLSEHPNIGGMKDSSGNMQQFAEIISSTSKDFSFFVGNAPTFFTALSLGACGGILAVANVLPNECVYIQKLFDEGKLEEAKELQLKIIPLAKAVTTKYGISGLKFAMDCVGYYGGEARLPLLPLKEGEKEEIRKMVKEFI